MGTKTNEEAMADDDIVVLDVDKLDNSQDVASSPAGFHYRGEEVKVGSDGSRHFYWLSTWTPPPLI